MYWFVDCLVVVGLVFFSSLMRFWGECSTISRLLFFFSFWNGDKLAHTNSTFMPVSVHSGSASWDDCGRKFLKKLPVSSFPDRFPHYAWTAAYPAHADFVGSRVYACLDVNCHMHFWQNDRGLLRATAVKVVERTPSKSQHTKLTLAKKILPPLLPGFELATFRSRVRRSNNELHCPVVC